VNLSNGLAINNKKEITFKAYIDKGNNGLLLKSVVKRRWWWHLVEEIDSCHLLWTEWNSKEFTDKLPCIERETVKIKT
jgi:tubulin--tyrosine ligase